MDMNVNKGGCQKVTESPSIFLRECVFPQSSIMLDIAVFYFRRPLTAHWIGALCGLNSVHHPVSGAW